MLITSASLDALRVGFKTNFQEGLGQAKSQYKRVATDVPASHMEEKYGFLGNLPSPREWVGPRHIEALKEHDYSIKEKPWEITIGVSADHIETDNLGQFASRFKAMGLSVGRHPDILVWDLIKKGFTTKCYDGQNFFDTDHPVLDANGVSQSVANTDGGSGTPWFLMATQGVMKPIIFQERKKFEFVQKDDPKDDRVFMNRQYVYGSDARNNVGYGFWQFAWGSKQPLTKANYKTAREALMGMKGDHDVPLGNLADLLVHPPSLEGEALEILNAERDAAGATNVYKGTAEGLNVPWLA